MEVSEAASGSGAASRLSPSGLVVARGYCQLSQ